MFPLRELETHPGRPTFQSLLVRLILPSLSFCEYQFYYFSLLQFYPYHHCLQTISSGPVILSLLHGTVRQPLFSTARDPSHGGKTANSRPKSSRHDNSHDNRGYKVTKATVLRVTMCSHLIQKSLLVNTVGPKVQAPFFTLTSLAKSH